MQQPRENEFTTVDFASELAHAAAEDLESVSAPDLVLQWEEFKRTERQISADNVIGIQFYNAPPILPPELFELRNLRSLQFYGDQSVFPPGVGKLEKLEKLDISIPLTSFPREILDLHALRILEFQAAMPTIPDGIRELRQLRSLCLFDNPLGEVPSAIRHLPQLRYLNLLRPIASGTSRRDDCHLIRRRRSVCC